MNPSTPSLQQHTAASLEAMVAEGAYGKAGAELGLSPSALRWAARILEEGWRAQRGHTTHKDCASLKDFACDLANRLAMSSWQPVNYHGLQPEDIQSAGDLDMALALVARAGRDAKWYRQGSKDYDFIYALLQCVLERGRGHVGRRVRGPATTAAIKWVFDVDFELQRHGAAIQDLYEALPARLERAKLAVHLGSQPRAARRRSSL